MSAESYDIVIVGGGTGGAFAAATTAAAGLETVILERKSAENAGHIACGDAIKGTATFPDVMDLDYLKTESFTNQSINRAVFENPADDDEIEIEFRGPGAVLDRKRYGEIILEEVDRIGADIHYDTVVQDVVQADDRTVTGVTGKRKGAPVEYEAEIVIDATGALSILQDKIDFADSFFDTNVRYSQFCSAYREVIEVDEPVEWEDALVFKPTDELGYLWYFPRTPTRINVGVGFQMDQPEMQMISVIEDDINSRPELKNPRVVDKLGAAVPTRRPYDSAIAPGYLAVGDAAGHVNPTTGGGIPGAAKSAHWAALRAIDAIEAGDVSQTALWEYNRDVMTDFGKHFAAIDCYNIWGTAHTVDELTEIVSSVPAQHLADAMSGKDTGPMSLSLKLQTIADTFGHWEKLLELVKVRRKAGELSAHYERYPATPGGFPAWQSVRDDIMDDIYEISGADPKY
jgi:electron-transferring-flavoprotein dehydrogenase